LSKLREDAKRFKDAFVALHKKYQDTDISDFCTADDGKDAGFSEEQQEYTRQKEYLEKTIESLKRKLKKDSEVHRLGNMRILGENVALIKEINELRKEISFLQHEKQLTVLLREEQQMTANGGGNQTASTEQQAAGDSAITPADGGAT